MIPLTQSRYLEVMRSPETTPEQARDAAFQLFIQHSTRVHFSNFAMAPPPQPPPPAFRGFAGDEMHDSPRGPYDANPHGCLDADDFFAPDSEGLDSSEEVKESVEHASDEPSADMLTFVRSLLNLTYI